MDLINFCKTSARIVLDIYTKQMDTETFLSYVFHCGFEIFPIFASSLRKLCFRENFFFRDISVRVLRKV